MNIKQIFKNNEAWIQKRLSEDQDYFATLGKGQSPTILYIGCSDSRVAAEEMMGLNPGEAFIHRNVGNIVVPIDLNAASVITYAVNHLEVEHIIVCGHYGCGAIKAALENKDLDSLNPWLLNIRDIYRLHKVELDAIADEEQKYRRFVEINVTEQCINVVKSADVQKAYKKRDILVHGWVFDVHTGKLIDLKIDFENIINKIREIYRLF